ncbi:hypothetical protein DFH29DRAFT_997709 [Suillus ampliporus]|nr:hypothetical protein DFH29DRAFT_997709 [Suillus ampliporus]
MSPPLLFSTIEVTRQAFYRSTLSYAIVNLKPIVPGHVLVIPNRPVSRLTDLTTPELTSLITSVQNVGRVIEHAYGGDALTVACQDGKAAGTVYTSRPLPYHASEVPWRLLFTEKG